MDNRCLLDEFSNISVWFKYMRKDGIINWLIVNWCSYRKDNWISYFNLSYGKEVLLGFIILFYKFLGLKGIF